MNTLAEFMNAEPSRASGGANVSAEAEAKPKRPNKAAALNGSSCNPLPLGPGPTVEVVLPIVRTECRGCKSTHVSTQDAPQAVRRAAPQPGAEARGPYERVPATRADIEAVQRGDLKWRKVYQRRHVSVCHTCVEGTFNPSESEGKE